jgi:hypothetical protein
MLENVMIGSTRDKDVLRKLRWVEVVEMEDGKLTSGDWNVGLSHDDYMKESSWLCRSMRCAEHKKLYVVDKYTSLELGLVIV